jgi:hypothetical protein
MRMRTFYKVRRIDHPSRKKNKERQRRRHKAWMHDLWTEWINAFYTCCAILPHTWCAIICHVILCYVMSYHTILLLSPSSSSFSLSLPPSYLLQMHLISTLFDAIQCCSMPCCVLWSNPSLTSHYTTPHKHTHHPILSRFTPVLSFNYCLKWWQWCMQWNFLIIK